MSKLPQPFVAASGFCIARLSNGTIELQAIQNPKIGDVIFGDDESAWESAISLAMAGNNHALATLQYIARNASAEFAFIENHAAYVFDLNNLSCLWLEKIP